MYTLCQNYILVHNFKRDVLQCVLLMSIEQILQKYFCSKKQEMSKKYRYKYKYIIVYKYKHKRDVK